MSARNHTTCPQCKKEHGEEVEALESTAASSYGKVSLEEYRKLLNDCAKLRNKKLPESLGEYYEMGFDSDGVFRFRYNCVCDVCGFHFLFKSESNKVNFRTTK